MKVRFLWVALLAAGLAPLIAGTAAAQSRATTALVISLDGVVDPLAARYVERGVIAAESDGHTAVLLRIDTPGGLDSSMRTIIKAIQDVGVPVVCWVGPAGARAASAGAIIMLGCPVATMAPATNVGAAHPVGITGEVLADKVTNDAAAYARSLAEARDRDPDIAERMVRESISLPADEALEAGMIDAIARDETEALEQVGICGAEYVPVPSGDCGAASLTTFEMSFMESLLHNAIDPNLAYLLFVLGLLGVMTEILHPGITVGGVFGGIALIAAFVILGMLPVNLAGLLLILAGIALMAAEVYLPGGVAGAAGLVALVLGGLFLFDASIPSAQVSKGLIIGMVLAVVAFFLTVVRAVMRSRRQPPGSATSEDLVGEDGIVERTLEPTGIVRARNESWTARATGDPIPAGTRVRVTKVDGLTLEVEPIDEPERSGVDA